MTTETATPQLSSIIDAAYHIGMLQKRDELAPFCEWLAKRRIKNFLEIGVWKGGSFSVWDHLSQPGLHIGIDPNTQPGIILTPQQLADRQALFGTLKPTVAMLMMDSMRQSTVDAVRNTLDGELLDFLFIDGNHKQPAVHHDYVCYTHFVRPGGIIAIHDIASWRGHGPDRRNMFPGCTAVWDTICSTKPDAVSFIDTDTPAGIGAIVKR